MRPNRRDEILAQAIRLFAAKGFHATSVQDIADAVGMSKAGLYSSFASKESLLEAIFYSIIDGMLDHLQQIVASDAHPAEKLRQAIISQVVGTADHIQPMTIYYQERRHLSESAGQRVAARRRAYEALLETLLAEGQAQASFRPCDVKVTAFGIAGMCAWTYRWFHPDGRLTAAQIGSQYADLVIGGLRPSEALPPKE